ncbi:MAG: NADH-quinone oxidoreductase subunit A [Planctomycetota bacterium]
MTDVLGIVMFVIGGVLFVLVSLTVGKVFRPRRPGPMKGEIYECGEPTVGPGWVQFDLRFYVVAMLFVIFDVEIALLYPWARVFPQFPKEAFWDLAFFVGLLLVGYAFAWKYGYLDWTRSRPARRSDDNQLPPEQEP